MSDRKLVTIRKIDEIRAHDNADSLEILLIDGWQVVAQKGIHTVGDYVVYFEIDSWIPTEIAPFLSKGKEPKLYEDIKGERLRTIRLRGQLSQGLVIPLYDKIINEKLINHYGYGWSELTVKEACEKQEDLSEILNVKKYEKPIPANLAGIAKGNFPSFISKTDQERIQNLWKEYKEKYNNVDWEVSIKLDGTSFTAFFNNGQFGVCSRNLELIEDDNNAYWKIAKQYKLKEKLEAYGKNIAIQGEIIGEGVQQNIDKIKGQELFVFDIYNIDKQIYFSPTETYNILNHLNIELYSQKLLTMHECEICKLQIVPSIRSGFFAIHKLNEFETIEDILKFAEGKSINSDCREGLVFKSVEYINNEILSFKVISNKFLEKYE